VRLYLVRHAQSVNNAGISQGLAPVPDPPLTELGQAQTLKLAEMLSTAHEPDQLSDLMLWRTPEALADGSTIYRFTRIVTSPMLRALQTTQPLAEALNVPVKVWPDICERGGIYQRIPSGTVGLPGLTRRQIREQFPGYDLPTTITDDGWWRGNRETPHAFAARAEQVAAIIRDRAAMDWSDDHVLMLSHFAFIDALLRVLLGTPDGVMFYFYNTSVTRLDFSDRGIVVRGVNRVDHLPPEMVS
jgi:2,3-bisphosphoglycerate-dependent phosphoglycerate mutase